MDTAAERSCRRRSPAEPLRVLLLVTRSSPLWYAAWDDTEAVMKMAVQQLLDRDIISCPASAPTATAGSTAAAAAALVGVAAALPLPAASSQAKATTPASTSPPPEHACDEAETASPSSSAARQPAARLLVKHHWGLSIHIVFDVNHTAYDAALSHRPEHNILPVLRMSLGGNSPTASATATATAAATAVAVAHTAATTTTSTTFAPQIALASAALAEKVNAAVARAHDLNGVGSEPPFVEDHREGKFPVYLYSRRCCPSGPPDGERSYHEGRHVDGRVVWST